MIKSAVVLAIIFSALPVSALAADPVVKRFEYGVNLTFGGVPYSGTAVWEMTTVAVISTGNSSPLRHRVRGEAIAFDLGANAALFVAKRGLQGSTPDWGALLTECGPGDLAALKAFDGECKLSSRPVLILAEGDIHGKVIPSLRVLSDDDFRSMEIRTSRTVSVTQSPITTGLVERYPWIALLDEGRPPAAHSSDAFIVDSRKIYKFDFIPR